tara:strand:+ start:550 stop:1566 length:1017 start_codon:yes stop_codon:yes gene_type:complete
MKNFWLKFGCFLTGYNYDIMNSCSEASAKSVKKFTSAILIISLIWGFIGFSFANRYLHLDLIGSLIGSLIMVFIVIQIEKQIILNVGTNTLAIIFRVGIALIMALLGSLIIDQIIFKEDIEIAQISKVNSRVEERLSSKLSEINNEIFRLDSLISEKNSERLTLIDEITLTPTISMPGYKTTTTPHTFTREEIDNVTGEKKLVKVDSVKTTREYSSISKENPKVELIPIIDNEINKYTLLRTEYVAKKLDVRNIVEKEEKNKMGFLDELDTMKVLVLKDWSTIVVWLLWFLFFMFIELFVVTSKMGKNNKTDYDETILHQRDIRIKAIKELSYKTIKV